MATENNSLGVLGKVSLNIKILNELPKEVQENLDKVDPLKQPAPQPAKDEDHG